MDKVLIITGTTSGIGEFLTQYYLDKNWVVVGCGRRESKIIHSKYDHFVCDLRNENATVDFVGKVISKYKKINVLINNAGYDKRYHTMFMPYNVAQNTVTVNFLSAFLMCKEVVKIMIKERKGKIINLSSIAVPLLIEGESIYAASKSAINTFTKILAKELYKFNITVNAIGPSFLETEMTKDISEEQKKYLMNLLTTKKSCSFQGIAYATDFFINDEANSVTGQVIYLGGV